MSGLWPESLIFGIEGLVCGGKVVGNVVRDGKLVYRSCNQYNHFRNGVLWLIFTISMLLADTQADTLNAWINNMHLTEGHLIYPAFSSMDQSKG